MALELHVHCKSVLIVPVADLPPNVLGIWTSVNETLGVMDVSVLRGTTWSCWKRRVGHVDEDDAGFALVSSRHRSDRVRHLAFLVDNHIVCAACRQTIEVPGQIDFVVECCGFGWINGEQLCPVSHAFSLIFRANRGLPSACRRSECHVLRLHFL